MGSMPPALYCKPPCGHAQRLGKALGRRYRLFSPQATIKAPSGRVRGSMRSASRAIGPADGKNTAERMQSSRTAIPENSAFTSPASCHLAPR